MPKTEQGDFAFDHLSDRQRTGPQLFRVRLKLHDQGETILVRYYDQADRVYRLIEACKESEIRTVLSVEVFSKEYTKCLPQ